jgi:hypothetical protein
MRQNFVSVSYVPTRTSRHLSAIVLIVLSDVRNSGYPIDRAARDLLDSHIQSICPFVTSRHLRYVSVKRCTHGRASTKNGHMNV